MSCEAAVHSLCGPFSCTPHASLLSILLRLHVDDVDDEDETDGDDDADDDDDRNGDDDDDDDDDHGDADKNDERVDETTVLFLHLFIPL